MTISLFGLAALTGTAAAQSEPRPVYTPPVYNAKISPWPTAAAPAAPAPAAAPAAGAWGTQPAPAAPRTFYYKKEPGTGVIPAANVYQTPAQDQSKPADKSDPLAAAKTPEVKAIVERPSRDKLFRLESENDLQKRFDFERKEKDPKTALLEFPTQNPISKEGAYSRSFAQMAIQVEPHYVCYGRLFFEEKNTERYGWDLGPLTPFILSAQFVGDVTSLPYKVFSFPRLRYDSSAGLCLPGDPVPLLAYPQGLSVTGGLAQAGVTVALYAIFP